LTLLVTTSGADALTIEARIAEEEAQLKLDIANEELAWIDETVIILDNEV
jgi:hypothetical protein